MMGEKLFGIDFERKLEELHYIKKGNHPLAKLSDNDVLDIRTKYLNGASYSALSDEYAINPKTIRDLLYLKSYKSSPLPYEEPEYFVKLELRKDMNRGGRGKANRG